MPAVTIKNIPPELYEKIKKNASLNYRSINSEIIFRLEQAFSHRPVDAKKLIQRIEELQRRFSLPLLNDDVLTESKNFGRP